MVGDEGRPILEGQNLAHDALTASSAHTAVLRRRALACGWQAGDLAQLTDLVGSSHSQLAWRSESLKVSSSSTRSASSGRLSRMQGAM